MLTHLKNQLRQQLKNKQINPDLKILEEAVLLAKTKSYIIANSPKIIGLYAPLPDEPNITPLHDFCQNNGIKTAYPAIEKGSMAYHLINNVADLKKGVFNFKQPPSTYPQAEPDLLIVPGLAFNTQGARLGRGQGHFDKYLEKHKPKTLALAFTWMLVNNIPMETHDKMIDLVISC